MSWRPSPLARRGGGTMGPRRELEHRVGRRAVRKADPRAPDTGEVPGGRDLPAPAPADERTPASHDPRGEARRNTRAALEGDGAEPEARRRPPRRARQDRGARGGGREALAASRVVRRLPGDE